jgi:hypothetical protein
VTLHPRRSLLRTWWVLLLATSLGYWLGSRLDVGPRQTRAILAVSILLIAIIKCRIVMRNYMDVRLAPPWLQWTCDSWLLLNFGMVLAYYWIAA